MTCRHAYARAGKEGSSGEVWPGPLQHDTPSRAMRGRGQQFLFLNRHVCKRCLRSEHKGGLPCKSQWRQLS